jgi:UDP-N-acetyl-D-glucosamine dehydrogenase
MTSEVLSPAGLAAKDGVVIVTDHSAVDYEMILRHAPLVIDSRGVYRQPAANVVKA